MKKYTAGLILVSLCLLSVPAVAKPFPVIPEKSTKQTPVSVVDFSFKTLNKGVVSLKDYKGKVLLINFFATWCPPCTAEIPHFVALQKQYAAKGLVIIGISEDEDATPVMPFISKKQIQYPVGIAPENASKFFGRFSSIPTTFIVDKTGHIVETVKGYASKDEWEAKIKPLL